MASWIPTLSQRLPQLVASLIAVSVIVSPGCSKKQEIPVQPTTGRLTINGEPAVGAIIGLYPVSGDFDQRGTRPAGQVKQDGAFTISSFGVGDGAPTGEYNVSIFWPQFPGRRSYDGKVRKSRHIRFDSQCWRGQQYSRAHCARQRQTDTPLGSPDSQMEHATLFKALCLCLLSVIGVTALIRSSDPVGDASNHQATERSKRNQTPLSESPPPGFGSTPLEISPQGSQYLVRHQLGTVIVPMQPTRICALAFTDELLAIGVTPFAASCTNGEFPDYLRDRLEGAVAINQLMGVGQPDFETIVVSQPDLIITSAGDPQTYHQLSKIAPVVVLSGDGDNNRQRVLDLGKLLDKERSARDCVSHYDQRIRNAKRLLHETIGDRKVAFFRIFGKQFYIHGHTRGGLMLYDELGLATPALIDQSPRGFMLSPESLLQLDAEFIFLAVEANRGAQRSWKSLLSHPAWQRVPAVRDGRVFLLPEQHHWLRPGFLAKSMMLDEIVRSILGPNRIQGD
ncbi:iron-siderophore ABC transporter substrate-binding protein [Rhodopirellula sp. MGV]|uniref:ABC transporter substrate-binding protein n=1 Tax=Rhodopirellula sp. MGV TaxID=2023130 RepID=UPI000B979D39|nr:iron-siderophore ABC transporter substrate-binding protein [Rhodopirellula sp. MGV]OYP32963.1 hypothetical protein CGZ80_18865 [Rhodopirellula sp. MGV]PNY35380.1 iron-siderophore ABC transporter substrate-binding protein [Rhodopirellula baltica]